MKSNQEQEPTLIHGTQGHSDQGTTDAEIDNLRTQLSILGLMFGVVGLGSVLAATMCKEWKITSGATSVITATWVSQGLCSVPRSPHCVQVGGYELGTALFIGWAGAVLCILGGLSFCLSVAEDKHSPRTRYGAMSFLSSQTKAYSGATEMRSAKSMGTAPKEFDKNSYV